MFLFRRSHERTFYFYRTRHLVLASPRSLASFPYPRRITLANRHQARLNGRFVKAATGIPQPVFSTPTPDSPPTPAFYTPLAPSPISIMPSSSTDPAPPPHLTPVLSRCRAARITPHQSSTENLGPSNVFSPKSTILASKKGCPSVQTILATLSYAPTQDYELWLSLKSASGDQWDIFVAELCTLYPGSEGDRKYNRENLDALTRSSALVPMTDHLQFWRILSVFPNHHRFPQNEEPNQRPGMLV